MSTEGRGTRVSVGVPVYNGENFLEEALRSILGQTFEDFELVISDNASTDRTADICRDFGAVDQRIRYIRQPKNIGVSLNSNEVFRHATGDYFVFLSHDDVWAPTFLERCSAALDAEPSAVVAYARTATIDDHGNVLRSWAPRSELARPEPHRRFREILTRMEPFVIFGLMRSDVLRRTSLFGKFWGADFALIAELVFHGPFVEVPEQLFFLRHHGERSTFVFDWRKPERTIGLWDPERVKPFLTPHWNLMNVQRRFVARADIPVAEKVRCYRALVRYAATSERRAELWRDLVVLGGRAPGLGGLVTQMHEGWAARDWLRRARRAAADMRPVIPPDAPVLLADQASLPPEEFSRWSVTPFPESNGHYAGCPPDDVSAIGEVERLRAKGADYLAIAWPSFWWLQHYADWSEYLRARFPCVLQNDRVVLFDLRQ